MSRPEFSRRVPLSRIGAHGLEQEIEASEAERAALARRLQIPAVISLRCSFQLEPPKRGKIKAEGELRAEVTQLCVVTLEPFEATLVERFDLRFVPEGGEAETFDPEAPDDVPYPGDAIDLGETAAEQLALNLDPYPRRPGLPAPDYAVDGMPDVIERPGDATIESEVDAADAEERRPHPFAVLARRGPGGSGGGRA